MPTKQDSPSTDPRHCRRCGRNLTGSHPNRKYCRRCSRLHAREYINPAYHRNYYRKNRRRWDKNHHKYQYRYYNLRMGTINFGSRMSRRHDRPDFRNEQKAVKRQLRLLKIQQKKDSYNTHYAIQVGGDLPQDLCGSTIETPQEPPLPLTRVQLYRDWRYWKPNPRRQKKT